MFGLDMNCVLWGDPINHTLQDGINIECHSWKDICYFARFWKWFDYCCVASVSFAFPFLSSSVCLSLYLSVSLSLCLSLSLSLCLYLSVSLSVSLSVCLSLSLSLSVSVSVSLLFLFLFLFLSLRCFQSSSPASHTFCFYRALRELIFLPFPA